LSVSHNTSFDSFPGLTAGSSARQNATTMFSAVGITPRMKSTSRLKFL
jgi:hypothetical protein